MEAILISGQEVAEKQQIKERKVFNR
jgi:hypothetical protein